MAAAVFPEAPPESAVAKQPHDRLGERTRIIDRHHQSGLFVQNGIGKPSDVGHDERLGHQQRLDRSPQVVAQ